MCVSVSINLAPLESKGFWEKFLQKLEPVSHCWTSAHPLHYTVDSKTVYQHRSPPIFMHLKKIY
jgi:hypothetical protein